VSAIACSGHPHSKKFPVYSRTGYAKEADHIFSLGESPVLRPLPLPILLALSACAPAATTEPEKFVLADPAKYKTEAERARAQQLAETDCKAKAIAAGAAIEKSIASERNSLENLSRAREKAAEMSATSFTLCMLNNGYIKR
jgi:hypothetical protein